MDRAISNYIYFKNNSWLANKATLMNQIGSMNISDAYNQNAARLEANMNIGNLPNNFIDEVIKLLDFNQTQSDFLEEQQNNFFKEIENFISKMSQEKLFGDVTIGVANIKLKESVLDAKQVESVVKNFQKILETIDKFDEGFRDLGKFDISFLDKPGMEKTKIAYNEILKFTKSDHPLTEGKKLSKEIVRLIGLLLGDLKGGLLEFADYIHSYAISTIHKEISDAIVKIKDAQLTGTQDIPVPKELEKALGQKVFRSKADNIITVGYDKDEVHIELNFGISDKSYKSSKASGKSLAQGVKWQALFHEAYYLNLHLSIIMPI